MDTLTNKVGITVGIISPGDMGHVVSRVLIDHGLRVVSCLAERSQRTQRLAAKAGVTDLLSYAELVEQADLILSILVPAQAVKAAQRVAEATTQADVLYVDCNAVAPRTVKKIDRIIKNVGGNFLDASIIGPPPRSDESTRFYASGPNVGQLNILNQYGLEIRPLGQEIGQASAIKMCYAALTKGLTALCAELLTAAETLGVSADLAEEFELSQTALYQRMQKGLPSLPSKSRRWIGEMEEIAVTFADVGLTPNILAGAADIFRFISQTELASLSPEQPDAFPSMEKMITQLARDLQS
ncbi:6-phosphogluconate dehydrogenase [Candidatus Poribacteria bacterium]|nr:6-phosphogluconate dehydrogenase [Candidatus Poribacteria bacterium]